MSTRGLYRGYWSGGKRAGQVRRLHIIREDGPKGWAPGKQTMCGQGAWDCHALGRRDPGPAAGPAAGRAGVVPEVHRPSR